MIERPENETAVSDKAWPEDGLIQVTKCPVCNSDERNQLYSNCSDVTFRIAPGRWTMWRCRKCGTAWLDPMPSPERMELAYSEYYTHAAEDQQIVRRIGIVRGFIHDLVEGYAAKKYLAKSDHANTLGRWIIPLIPPIRSAVDVEYRHLEEAPSGGRLLDIGCGNGMFLERAEKLGWDAVGLEPDRKAVSIARGRGLSVRRGGFELLDSEPAERYDIVTLSHVIEHVHDPRRLVGTIHRLLKTGGRFWLETPNLNSLGHRKYGRHWRDLDVPRHLVLFQPSAIRNLLTDTGFCNVTQRWRGLVLFGIFAMSEAISRQEDALGASRKGRPPLPECLDELREMVQPSCREYLTFISMKC